jgi:hypothetical protein
VLQQAGSIASGLLDMITATATGCVVDEGYLRLPATAMVLTTY